MTEMNNSANFKKLGKNELDKIKGGDSAGNGGDLIIVHYGKKLNLPKPKK